MTNEEALEAFNTFMRNSGLVLIKTEDIQRIRDLAKAEGLLDKLKALDVKVWQEFGGEMEEEAPLVPLLFSKG